MLGEKRSKGAFYGYFSGSVREEKALPERTLQELILHDEDEKEAEEAVLYMEPEWMSFQKMVSEKAEDHPVLPVHTGIVM
ncbi:MAG: hypothetical protein LUD73_07245 [Lachnospiraceae bacterium]|nr:hypothetical protein [Lachnospiraceae bacterium]